MKGGNAIFCGSPYHSLPSNTNERQLYMIPLPTCNCMPPEFRRPASSARALGQGSPLPCSGHGRGLSADAGRLTKARDGNVVSGSLLDPTTRRSSGRGRRLRIRRPVRPTLPSLRALPTISSSSLPCGRFAFRPLDPAQIRLGGVAVHTDGVSAPPCSSPNTDPPCIPPPTHLSPPLVLGPTADHRSLRRVF